MIQRIQTVYLFIALVLTGCLFFLDLAEFSTISDHLLLQINGITSSETSIIMMPTVALFLLQIITSISIVTSIFLYKKRILQIRLSGFNMGLLLGISVLIFYFSKVAAREFDAELAFRWPLVLPLISIIFVYLAIRAIGKDEALIRSLDRIR